MVQFGMHSFGESVKNMYVDGGVKGENYLRNSL